MIWPLVFEFVLLGFWNHFSCISRILDNGWSEPSLNIIEHLIKNSQQEENYTSTIQISLSVNNPVVKNESERKIIIEIMFMVIMRLLISLKSNQTRVERTSTRTHTARTRTVSDTLLGCPFCQKHPRGHPTHYWFFSTNLWISKLNRILIISFPLCFSSAIFNCIDSLVIFSSYRLSIRLILVFYLSELNRIEELTFSRRNGLYLFLHIKPPLTQRVIWSYFIFSRQYQHRKL